MPVIPIHTFPLQMTNLFCPIFLQHSVQGQLNALIRLPTFWLRSNVTTYGDAISLKLTPHVDGICAPAIIFQVQTLSSRC